MNNPYYNLDHEIAFINGLAAGLKSRTLSGYVRGLKRRTRDFGSNGAPFNEGARAQLIARAELHILSLPEPRRRVV